MYRDTRKLTNASAIIGARCDHADGLYDHPDGTAGPFICMPIGMIRPNAISSAPINVPFAYAAASGAQNTRGASSTQRPTNAISHETRPRFLPSARIDIASATAPLVTSLHVIAAL